MMSNRYVVWTAVWEWFQGIDTREKITREKWDALYELLNRLWQEERANASPEALAAHAKAINTLKQ